jgi:thymidylate kinase
MVRKGLLVVVEGINGAGKTTIINKLAEHYHDTYISFSIYKFPNRDGENGERIDRYLKGNLVIDSKYDVLDLFASNRSMARNQIDLDLKNGMLVICDRYVFSAIAYHIPMHVSKAHLIESYCKVIGYFDKHMPVPDITYVIKGDHLIKRGIVHHERFHYYGDKAARLTNLLWIVANHYTQNCIVVSNNLVYLDISVNVIIEDIRKRAYSLS